MVYATNIAKKNQKRPKMTALRRQLFEQHNGICAYCKRRTEMPSMLPGRNHDLTATVEHVMPVSRGGHMRGTNVTLACTLCNTLKADKTPHQWAEFMMLNPEWWLHAGSRVRASDRRFARRQVLPIEETQMILRDGKKAWKKWKSSERNLDICPVMTMVAQFFYEQRYGVWTPRNPDTSS